MELCWLSCPDDVIHKGYNFLKHVSEGERKSDEAKEEALGAFILAMRRDLVNERPWWWKWTKLNPNDFRILKATSGEGHVAVPSGRRERWS